ncbi:MAG: sugar kinase [Candidatus Krumholzibacteriota bacterium]|nr:sugar kinase [Candidatus Krumholzibacteriota bacterium]
MSLVIVGSVAFDTIETPRGRVERALGGSATYSSLAASYFTPARLVGVVGEDFTAGHRKVLEEKGIDLEGLRSVKGGKTFFWAGRYGEDPNDRDTLATELNVFERFKPRLPESYRRAGWVFLGNIDPDVQLRVIDQMEGKPTVGCDTMNFWIEGKPERLAAVLERVDILFINDGEARQLSGRLNLLQAGREILKMGPTAVVIKKGEHGALLITEDFRCVIPAYPLEEVLDPTGAGDSFAGGFMGHLAAAGNLNRDNLRRAMAYGTVTASFTCEDFSVERLKILTGEEIEERFERLKDLVRIEKE